MVPKLLGVTPHRAAQDLGFYESPFRMTSPKLGPVWRQSRREWRYCWRHRRRPRDAAAFIRRWGSVCEIVRGRCTPRSRWIDQQGPALTLDVGD